MIKGELIIKENPDADVFKWVATFDAENGETIREFGETKSDVLSKLSIKIQSTDWDD